MPPHRAALEDARRLLERLAAAEREHLSASPYRLVHEHDMRGGRYLVRARSPEPVPERIVVLAGDVVRTLRGALDALASELAGTSVSFPIFESLVLFAQRARKAISRMSDDAQASLEALQPYHAIGGFRNGPLWRLRQLDVVPPPRLVGSIRDDAALGVNTQRHVSIAGDPEVTVGPFGDGAVVASVPTRIAGPDPKLDMFFRADFALAYAGGEPGIGRAVVPLLGELCDHVEREVFGALDRSRTN